MSDSCIFCQIAAGKERASFVWDDPDVIGMMSLEQPTLYKVLMIPRKHVESLFDLSDELAAKLFQDTVKVARAVRDASSCPGLNIVQSNGKIGQQDVFHFHLHIVPRFKDDGIILKWDNTVQERAKLDALAQEIRAAVNRGKPNQPRDCVKTDAAR
jgi:histidine triad (HIT) family protein